MSTHHHRRRTSSLRQTIAAGALALALPSVLAVSNAAAAEEPAIAAAASFRNALDEIAAQFETDQGKKVKITYGATGNPNAGIVANEWIVFDVQMVSVAD